MTLATCWIVSVESASYSHPGGRSPITGRHTLRATFAVDPPHYDHWLRHPLDRTTYDTADDAWAAARRAGLTHDHTLDRDAVIAHARATHANATAARAAYHAGDKTEAVRLLSIDPSATAS